MGVFLEDLPKGLAPRRTETWFKVELKGDLKPVEKDLYRMSHSELAETKKQVEYLIEWGLIYLVRAHGNPQYCSPHKGWRFMIFRRLWSS